MLFSGLLLSLGALGKLPFILYYIVPLTYFILEIINKRLSKDLIINIFSVFGFIIFPLPWYITVIPQWNGNGIVNGIAGNQVPFMVILDYLQHNLVSNLPELLLNYGSVLFFIAGFYFLIKNKSYKQDVPGYGGMEFWNFSLFPV